MLEPYYHDSHVTIYHGDCREVLPGLDPVETCITDPPYGLAFMGKEWDHAVPDESYWRLVRDAILPGGMLLAFGGTRLWHWLAVGIEQAGWEIRDTIMWLYGSGFPKSLDISKAIDRRRDDYDDVCAVALWLRPFVEAVGFDVVTEAFGFADETMARARWTSTSQPQVPKWDQWLKLKDLCDLPDDMDAEVWRLNGRKGQPGEAWAEREVVAERVMVQGGGNALEMRAGERREVRADITAPATDEAKTWDGWGSALKPSWEPVILAMNPTDGTFAENALEYGVAGLNIDGARIGYIDEADKRLETRGVHVGGAYQHPSGDAFKKSVNPVAPAHHSGRWPANLALDEEAARMLDEQSGYSESSSARFFYTSKASRSDRGPGNDHPTVKPSDLMKWLCTLTKTPEGGTVLDPFMGSGTTLYAAKETGRKAIGIEREEKWCEVAADRCSQGVLGL